MHTRKSSKISAISWNPGYMKLQLSQLSPSPPALGLQVRRQLPLQVRRKLPLEVQVGVPGPGTAVLVMKIQMDGICLESHDFVFIQVFDENNFNKPNMHTDKDQEDKPKEAAAGFTLLHEHAQINCLRENPFNASYTGNDKRTWLVEYMQKSIDKYQAMTGRPLSLQG